MLSARRALLGRASVLAPRRLRPFCHAPAALDREVTRTMSCFKGSTVKELKQFLEGAGVEVDGVYGHGLAKNLDDLLEEVQRHESILVVDGSKALRIVNVLSVHVLNSRGQVLYEEEQVLPDGRSRRRNVPLSEKMIGSEKWQQALYRAVAEELGSILPEDYKVTPFEESYFSRIELSSSMSYPGLLTKYIFHRVRARISGLPERPFSTVEARPTGQLLTHWIWRAVPTETF